MDSSLKKIDPNSSIRSTSKIINNIHSMSWLKQDSSSSSQNSLIKKDGKILSAKKTDEVYFPGTREEKKSKKKKDKKGKSVLTIDTLEDLVILTQQSEKRVTTVLDLEETSVYDLPIVQEEVNLPSKINISAPVGGTVWSSTASTADTLFPNVQSVRIDRLEEEDMLSRAIAESIATVQLEQFKRLTPEKENRWEALYGDNDDEGGWDNVKRNLPSAPETVNSSDLADDEQKSGDDNNNSSKSGILRNKQNNQNRYFAERENVNFGFKKCSEVSKNEIDAIQSLKSVSFDETVAVKVRSSESSENDEIDKTVRNSITTGSNIDKFGRIDGYSERRLFMGKGARMKEQEYIQNKCSLGVGDIRNQNSESNLQTRALVETQKPAITASQCPKTVQSRKPIANVKKQNFPRKPEIKNQKLEPNLQTAAIPKTQKPTTTTSQFPKYLHLQKLTPNVKEQNFNRTSETRNQKFEPNSQAAVIPKAQKSAISTSHSPKNLQPQISILNLNNPKIEKSNASKNFLKTPETPRDTKQVADTIKKLNRSAIKSPAEFLSSNHNSAIHSSTESSIGDLPSVKPELETSEIRELKAIAREVQTLDGAKNKEMCYDIASDSSFDSRTKEEEINHPQNELVSFSTATSDSDNEMKFTSSFDESKSPSQIEKKDVKDLQENMTQDMMSKNLAALLRIVDNVSDREKPEKESESKSNCLVPTLVGEDAANFPETSLHYANSIFAMSHNAQFQSPAHQNLLLAGVFDSDTNCDDRSLMSRSLNSQNFRYQNYSAHDSVHLNTVPTQSQTLNNVQHIQAESMRSGDCQNTPINHSPSLNSNTYCMPPNCTNTSNKAQMSQTEHAYSMHHFDAHNFPCHNAGLSPNPGHCNVSNFMESGENVLSSTRIQDSAPIADLGKVRHQKRTGNDGQRFSTAQAPPGLIKNLQLPSGFAKKEYTQRRTADENNPAINSPALTQRVRNVELEKEKFGSKKSLLQGTNNCCDETPGHPAQGRPAHYERNSTPSNNNNTRQTSRSFSNKQQNNYRPQTGLKGQGSQFAENRKVPYPILGASHNSPEKRSNFPCDNFKISQMSRLRGEAVNNRSSSMSESVLGTANDKTRMNWVGRTSNNNNYLTSSSPNTTSELDCQRMNDSLQNSNIISPSAVPVICQSPDQRSPGLSDMANWQYRANFMDPTQVLVNFGPYYQIPMSNPHNSPVNLSPDYFDTPMYQNPGFHQFPMHMLSPMQIPVYAIPHLLNTEGNEGRNVRPENIVSPETNSMVNRDPSVEMVSGGGLRSEVQGSIPGDYRCVDYNLNENPMGQFVANSNFYETGTIPNVQSSWNLSNNQRYRTTGKIFDNSNIGRGRGRLSKINLS